MSKKKDTEETLQKMTDRIPLTAEEIEAQQLANAQTLADANELANVSDANISEDGEPTHDDQDRIRQETQDANAAFLSAQSADGKDDGVKLDGDQLLQDVGQSGASKLNADGLVPGAPVDFNTLQKVERSRSPEEQATLAKNSQQPLKK